MDNFRHPGKIAFAVTCALLLVCMGCSNSDTENKGRPARTDAVVQFTHLYWDYIIDVSSHKSAKIDQDSIVVFDPSDLAQENRPADCTFPDGLLSFVITNLNPAGGDTVTVVITFPTAYDADATYYKVTDAGYEAFDDAVISGNQVTLTLTDNGRGDSDSIAGQITDPGGVAVLLTDYIIDNNRPMIVIEQIVNTETAYSQTQPELAALNGGGYVAVWQSFNQDGDKLGIYAQRFDATGTKLGSETQVNTTTAGMQQYPKVAGLADGGYVVLWINPTHNQYVGHGNLYFQRYGPDGAAAGGETLVGYVLNPAGFDQNYDIAVLAGGDFVITYIVNADGGDAYSSGRWGAAIQRFNEAGERTVGETIIDSDALTSKAFPSVAGLNDGGYVVAWQSGLATDEVDTQQIFLQRFDAAGQPLGEGTLVGATPVGSQRFPAVGALADGGFVVAWQHGDETIMAENLIVYTQRFDASGAPIGLKTQSSASQGYSLHPTISCFSDGGFIVAWQSPGDAGDWDIFARRFDGSGAPMEDVFLVNVRTDSDQKQPSVAVLADDSYAVAWTSLFSTGNRFEDIHAQRFLSAGIFTGDEDTTSTYDVLPYATDRDEDDIVSLYDCHIIEGGGSVHIVDGQIVFDPGTDFNHLAQGESAIVKIQFRVTDDSGAFNAISMPATVGLYIIGTNDLPVVSSPVSVWATEEDPAFSVDLLEHASDVDGDSLSITDLTLLGGDATGVTEGVNSLNINPAVYAYLNEGEDNIIEYSYTVSDGLQGVLQSATITIMGIGTEPEPDPDPAPGDKQVNTNIVGDQRRPVVAALSDGGYVVAWQSDGQDGDGYGIYFQRFAADGSEIGVETIANTTWIGPQWHPSVSGLTDGGFVITWRNGDTYTDDIYFQRFTSSGEKIGGETYVGTTTTFNDWIVAKVAGLNNGGFVVIWSDQDDSYTGVCAQQYDANGTKVGAQKLVNTITEYYQNPNSIAPLNDGGYLIAWTSMRQGGSYDDVYFQRYDSFGNAVGSETIINTTTDDFQFWASASALSEGGFVITWTSYGQDGDDYGICHQRYDSVGDTVGWETQVNTHYIGQQWDAHVSGLSDGGYVIVWTSGGGQDGSGDGVYLQRFASDGSTIDTETRINTTTAGDQNGIKIAAMGNGGYIVTWASAGQDGDGYGIFLKQFDSNGIDVTAP